MTQLNDDKVLEMAINAGAKDCISSDIKHEIMCEMKDFYKVKNEVEKVQRLIVFRYRMETVQLN